MAKLSQVVEDAAVQQLYAKCPECGDTGTGWPSGICRTCDGGRKKQRLADELGYRFEANEGPSSYAGAWVRK